MTLNDLIKVLSVTFLGVFLHGADTNNFDFHFQEGERLWAANDHSNSVKHFRQAILAKPSDTLSRALLCRGLFEMGELLPKKSGKEKLALYEEMIRLSGEGIRLDTNAAECYFMRALGNGRKATTKGILDSLFMARSMEQDWLRALDLGIRYVSPTREDSRADTFHALALYYRILPDSILLQWLFKTRGSLVKSLEYSRKALEISPNQCEMVLEMGVCLVAKGMEEKKQDLVKEGRLFLGKVLALPVVKKTDLIDKQHARMLLAQPELCRDYERDGQVERDLKKSKNLSPGTAARPMEQ